MRLSSPKSSISPTLALNVRASRQRTALLLLLILGIITALVLMLVDGHWLIGGAALPVAARLLWTQRAQPYTGALIRRGDSGWSITHQGRVRQVSMQARSALLPWLIYLSWSDDTAADRGSLWLFNDSAASEELRLLRVQLRLER